MKTNESSSLISYQAIDACAHALGGAREPGGINWTWYSGFPTRHAAEQFLEHPGIFEHRGIYELNGAYAVRLR